jgi:hypothetical protein
MHGTFDTAQAMSLTKTLTECISVGTGKLAFCQRIYARW